MKLDEIRQIARERGIKTGKLKKDETIRAIQADEGNDTCFASGRVMLCGQAECLWREECN